MDRQLVFDLLDAPYPLDLFDEILHLILEDVALKRDPAFGRQHRDRTGMGHHPSNGGADPIVQDLLIHHVVPKPGPKLGRGASDAIAGILGRGRDSVAELMAGVHPLVPQE
jgi:hypothetical protein